MLAESGQVHACLLVGWVFDVRKTEAVHAQGWLKLHLRWLLQLFTGVFDSARYYTVLIGKGRSRLLGIDILLT